MRQSTKFSMPNQYRKDMNSSIKKSIKKKLAEKQADEDNEERMDDYMQKFCDDYKEIHGTIEEQETFVSRIVLFWIDRFMVFVEAAQKYGFKGKSIITVYISSIAVSCFWLSTIVDLLKLI